MSNPAERAGPKATRRAWLGLAVIALPCVLATMDLEVLNLAVPALSAALHPSGSQLLWIVDSYGFLVAGSLVTMGTLGGVLPRYFWWGSVFLLAVPVMVLLLVLGLSPLVAGLWSLPAAAGLVLGSLLAPALARLARPA